MSAVDSIGATAPDGATTPIWDTIANRDTPKNGLQSQGLNGASAPNGTEAPFRPN